MLVSESKKGEIYIFSHVIFAALFPVLTAFTLSSVPSLLALFWCTLCATVVFAIIMTVKGSWGELRNVLVWQYSAGVTLFISVLYFGLTFVGLTMTTPGNAGLISLFEIFTSMLVFSVFRGEYLAFQYRVGALCMIGGAVIVLGRDFSGINVGDVFVLAATFCGPFGNVFQQKARMLASSATVLFLRSALAVPLIFLGALAWGQYPHVTDFRSWFPLLVNGVFIFGLSKILWVEGIHRISVTKAQALGSVTPLITLFLAWAFLGQSPGVWQFAAFVPLLFGTLLLTDTMPKGSWLPYR